MRVPRGGSFDQLICLHIQVKSTSCSTSIHMCTSVLKCLYVQVKSTEQVVGHLYTLAFAHVYSYVHIYKSKALVVRHPYTFVQVYSYVYIYMSKALVVGHHTHWYICTDMFTYTFVHLYWYVYIYKSKAPVVTLRANTIIAEIDAQNARAL